MYKSNLHNTEVSTTSHKKTTHIELDTAAKVTQLAFTVPATQFLQQCTVNPRQLSHNRETSQGDKF